MLLTQLSNIISNLYRRKRSSVYTGFTVYYILGLISCYLSLHRTREALACAGKAIKTIGSNPRTLTVSEDYDLWIPFFVTYFQDLKKNAIVCLLIEWFHHLMLSK